MARLIPFNHRNRNVGLAHNGVPFDEFYNMLDDFFGGSMLPTRNLLHDTFKIDIEESEREYVIEAELPGIQRDEIDLSVEGENLCICVNRSETIDKDGKNFIHRERRANSMSRRVRLAGADLGGIKARLEDGVLSITVPKDGKDGSVHKIDIE